MKENSHSSRASAMTRREMLALSRDLLATASCGLFSCNTANPSAKPNIIVYLADTLRADHLSCYGYSKKTSPFLDALSQEAYVFEQCRSQDTWTRPSIASLYTGVSPRAHKMTMTPRGQTLVSAEPLLGVSYTTLAQSLEEAGYDTALFLSNPVVRSELGFGRGFNHYRYVFDEDPGSQRRAVESWIASEASEPFFAVVHCLDPHGPYRALNHAYKSLTGSTQDESVALLPEQDREILKGVDDFYRNWIRPKSESEVASFLDEQKAPSERARALLKTFSKDGLDYFQNLYDAEITNVDSEVAKLFEFLSDHSLMDNTIVALTSDHGEAFNEHGQYLHGRGTMPYDELVHIPLLLWLPGVTEGKRIRTNVTLTDLHPTLLTLAGASCPPYVQGQPLLTISGKLLPDDGRPQMAWAELGRNPDDADVAMVLGNFKLMTFNDVGILKLFDLSTDPGEKVDLIENGLVRDDELNQLRERLDREKQDQAALATQFHRPLWMTHFGEAREQLEALGYL